MNDLNNYDNDDGDGDQRKRMEGAMGGDGMI
jgi:hypothetical protein